MAEREGGRLTCIAAAVDKDGAIVMGCDAVCQQDGHVRLSTQAKIFLQNGFLIGTTGSMRVRQIAEHLFKPPPTKAKAVAYMVLFANALRKAMKEHGGEYEDEDDKNQCMDGGLLVGYKSTLFEIDRNYGVITSRLPYYSVGSGGQDALSAMFTMHSLAPDCPAEELVNRGLLAAAEFDAGIRPPFTILKLDA